MNKIRHRSITQPPLMVMILSTFIVTFCIFTTHNTYAQDCGKAREVLKKIQSVGKKIATEIGCTYVNVQTGVPKPLCKVGMKVYDKAKSKARKMARESFRKLVKNSWATFGPRELELGKTQKGTLVSLGERMFVLPELAPYDEIQFELKKTDGKGKAGISICVMKEGSNKYKRVNHHIFKKGAKKGAHKYRLKKALGSAVMVHLKGKSATKKFKYKLKTKGIRK